MQKKESNIEKTKSCFVIMPISDMDGYEKNHFSRVYEHLIKPACIKAGYTPIRADEVASSNYIVIDILSKIVETDMVICDLSGRNPNVLYELGVRQAFNLPTVLIKDIQTDRIFDIQGLRNTEYDHSLRIDSVEKQISDISKAIEETESSKGKDVNSLIQLLGIKSASLPSQVELSDETSVILSAIKDLSSRVTSVEHSRNNKTKSTSKLKSNKIIQIGQDKYLINDEEMDLGEMVFADNRLLGRLNEVDPSGVTIMKSDGDTLRIGANAIMFEDLTTINF